MRFISSLSKSLALLASVVVLVMASLVFSSPAQAANYTVTMGAGGLKFGPKTVTVKPGDTITFKVGMLAPHNVVFNPAGSPDSATAKALSHPQQAYRPGQSFDVNIPADATPGKYGFYCTPHRGAGMVGNLIVE